jgi:hypothetical protein
MGVCLCVLGKVSLCIGVLPMCMELCLYVYVSILVYGCVYVYDVCLCACNLVCLCVWVRIVYVYRCVLKCVWVCIYGNGLSVLSLWVADTYCMDVCLCVA